MEIASVNRARIADMMLHNLEAGMSGDECQCQNKGCTKPFNAKVLGDMRYSVRWRILQ